MTSFDGRMSRSSEDFLRLVWPAVGAEFGTLIPVESVTDSTFTQTLDQRAGIDSWIVSRDDNIRGLASRVQWTDDPYETFTIRIRSRYGLPTEYDKRKRESTSPGALTPWYVCHAYISVDRTRLLAAAVARMQDVIQAIDEDAGWALRRNGDGPDGGSQGYAVPWRTMESRGCPIRIWRWSGMDIDCLRPEQARMNI